MTSARFTIPKHRLAEQLRTPGGLPAAEALAAAQDNLKALKEPCLAELQALLEAAEAVFARLGDDFDDARMAELYDVAVRGIGLGEVGGSGAVDVAMHSLCDLIDNLRGQQRHDAEAVGVHLRAWRLLMGAALPPEGVQAVLAGLTKVGALYTTPKPQGV